MGLVKQSLQEHFLTKYGFKQGNHPCNSSIVGFVHGYSHSLYYLWVIVCLDDREIHFYDEYDCGGEIASETISIPEEIDVESEKNFIEWLDCEVTTWIDCH